jgi:hypothetical protein
LGTKNFIRLGFEWFLWDKVRLKGGLQGSFNEGHAIVQVSLTSKDNPIITTRYIMDFNARSHNSSIVFWVPIKSYNEGQRHPNMSYNPSLIKWQFNGSWNILVITMQVVGFIFSVQPLSLPRSNVGHPSISF